VIILRSLLGSIFLDTFIFLLFVAGVKNETERYNGSFSETEQKIFDRMGNEKKRNEMQRNGIETKK
jgi:hypothetical protein